MPPAPRHLLSIPICVLTAALCLGAAAPAAAQGKTEPQATKTKPPVQPDVALPSAESIVILIRSTLVSLGDALDTGNFTVLRDLAAPSFREANNAGRLSQIFGNLAAQHIDLAAVTIMTPKLPEPPSIDANKRLHIAGFFPGEPMQINFDLQFEAVAGQWRLFGVAVRPVKSAGANASQAAPTEKKAPPQAKAGK
jgi:hypothetical protein